MSWEHDLANKIINKSPSISSGWYEGEVISPVRIYDEEEGVYIYVGPLIVTAFKGEVTLGEDRLVTLADGERPFAGCRVALLGDVFGKVNGGQKVLIVGVTYLAV